MAVNNTQRPISIQIVEQQSSTHEVPKKMHPLKSENSRYQLMIRPSTADIIRRKHQLLHLKIDQITGNDPMMMTITEVNRYITYTLLIQGRFARNRFNS